MSCLDHEVRVEYQECFCRPGRGRRGGDRYLETGVVNDDDDDNDNARQGIIILMTVSVLTGHG